MFKALSDNYQVFVAALTIKMCAYTLLLLLMFAYRMQLATKKAIDNLIIIIIIISRQRVLINLMPSSFKIHFIDTLLMLN